jgi:hypothetical protein
MKIMMIVIGTETSSVTSTLMMMIMMIMITKVVMIMASLGYFWWGETWLRIHPDISQFKWYMSWTGEVPVLEMIIGIFASQERLSSMELEG